MKGKRRFYQVILLAACFAIAGLSGCAAEQVSPAPYDENLSQVCNHLNSLLIQEHQGVFYELRPADMGFTLYRGSEADKIDEPMNISAARSGFWICEDRVFYRAGETGGEIRSIDTDGTGEEVLFTAPVQEFVLADEGIFWSDET